MTHESDGAILHWTKRILLCWDCASEYEQEWGKSADCPVCGRTGNEYDLLEEFYEGDADAT